LLNQRDDHGLFELLEPPPGGLTRLRSRIRRAEHRRARSWQLASATAGLAVIVVAVLLIPTFNRSNGQPLDIGSDLLAIRAGLVDPPAEPVTIVAEHRGRFAVQRIPTTDDRVVLYMVGSRLTERPTVQDTAEE